MLAVVGTVPEEDFPLLSGEVCLEKDHLRIGGRAVPVNRGTPALLAAAHITGETLGMPPPLAYLAGDIGLGTGSRLLYQYVLQDIHNIRARVITFHYLQPDVDWHNKVLFAVEEISPQPILVADAGFMYAAKTSGQAEAYELFTPDAGELAFLADEEAPHPFYTRGFILHEENRIPDLIKRAYDHGNAARFLLVKGSWDYVASRQGIVAVVDCPVDAAMEAIGGTGDTLTGIASALMAAGMETPRAAILAARVNRLAGHYARLDPGSQVMQLISHISRATKDVLKDAG